jgi:hypothetical protein
MAGPVQIASEIAAVIGIGLLFWITDWRDRPFTPKQIDEGRRRLPEYFRKLR